MPSSTTGVSADLDSGHPELGPRWGTGLALPARAVDTEGPLDVSAALSGLYEQSQLCTRFVPTGVKAQLKYLDLRSVQLAQLTISRAAWRMPDHPDFTVCFSIGGTIRSSINGEAVVTESGQCIVASPGGPVDVEYLTDDCRGLLVRFDRAFMEQELAAMLGRTLPKPLRFKLFVEPRAIAPFEEVLRLVCRDVEKPILTSHQALTERLLRLAASGLLVGAYHNYSDELSEPGGFTGPRPIQIALDSLEADPLRFATVGELAQVVSLSVRALEDGFKRHVGTTPFQYQRLVRLRRAHEDLINANPYDTTATAIACKWGYNNYGRFASEYRRIYGRTPLEDLRSSD